MGAQTADFNEVRSPKKPCHNWPHAVEFPIRLIQLGRFDEAEDYCLAAVEVEGHRHNAHKNLGLVYQGQGRWLDAALSFLTAYELNPRDPRAWHHLEQVLAARPVLLKQSESLRAGVEAMQKAIVEGGCSVMQ